MHGAVSLEISGYFEPDEVAQRYELLCASVLAPFLAHSAVTHGDVTHGDVSQGA